MVKAGDLGLLQEAGSTGTYKRWGNKLHFEKYTDLGAVKRVRPTGLRVDVEMQKKKSRKRTGATSTLKPPHDGLHADGHHYKHGQPDSSKSGF